MGEKFHFVGFFHKLLLQFLLNSNEIVKSSPQALAWYPLPPPDNIILIHVVVELDSLL